MTFFFVFAMGKKCYWYLNLISPSRTFHINNKKKSKNRFCYNFSVFFLNDKQSISNPITSTNNNIRKFELQIARKQFIYQWHRVRSDKSTKKKIIYSIDSRSKRNYLKKKFNVIINNTLSHQIHKSWPSSAETNCLQCVSSYFVFSFLCVHEWKHWRTTFVEDVHFHSDNYSQKKKKMWQKSMMGNDNMIP